MFSLLINFPLHLSSSCSNREVENMVAMFKDKATASLAKWGAKLPQLEPEYLPNQMFHLGLTLIMP